MTVGSVLDASVALKLVLAEAFSDQAEALLTTTLTAGQAVCGPPSLPLEILSALYQRARRGDPATAITLQEAEQYLAQFLALPIAVVSPPDLYLHTFAFARTHGLARTYDAVYVVLAQLLGVELWTADQSLLNALKSAAPWVRWIGDFPLTEDVSET
jgi:predicted nucleic acid-binding protein